MGELSQWLCHDDSIINIGICVIIILRQIPWQIFYMTELSEDAESCKDVSFEVRFDSFIATYL